MLSNRFNCPYIVTLHENPPWLEELLSNKASKILDSLICSDLITRPNSIDIIDLFKFDIDENRIIYLPNFVDDKSFPLATKEIKEANKELLNVKNKTIILNVASLEKIKGQSLLINAFSIIKEKMPNTELWIIGAGSEEANLRKLALEKDVYENVKFLGRVRNEEIYKYISCADMFAMPSISESFGISQVEAMLCGVPVVATNNFGSEEIIIEGINGFLCRSRNEKDFASLIEKSLSTNFNPEQIRKTAVERYGRVTSYKNILEAYRRAILNHKNQSVNQHSVD